jgi:hypothetical protein
MSGTSIIKNPKILVGETVRSTAVGTLRISHYRIVVKTKIEQDLFINNFLLYNNAVKQKRNM